MATSATPQAPNALRVAVVWGTSVVALKTLSRGQSFLLGDDKDCVLPVPDGSHMSNAPVRANAGGWELDARGCVGGLLTLRGRQEDPAAIASTAAAVPIMPGDFGLIQYGQISIFFQYTTQPIPISGRRGPEILVMLAALCSAILHIGGMGLLSTLSTPIPYPKPPELESVDDLARRFNMKRADLEPPPPEPVAGDKADTGVKDPGQNDKKDQGGGKKMKDAEGKLGFNNSKDKTQLPGESRPTTHLGGLTDVLEGDTGKEIKNTLQSINSVSSVLSGMNSATLVQGGGTGTGLKGGGPGGGGNGPGVAYGGGTLDTGFGGGNGGGFGRGGGGPGGKGTGGNGNGGNGGNGGGGGGGPGEAKVAVAPGTAAAKGGLSADQIHRVVMGHIGAVRACYETEAQRNPGLKGGVTIQWSIDPGGNVTSASVAGSTLSNPRVEGCVVRQVQRWKFPATDSPTTVAGFPFKFGVGG